jgi:hypothetical protein
MRRILVLFTVFTATQATTTTTHDDCEWSVANLLMESSSRALLHYCLATSPASEDMVQLGDEIKTPSAVIEKYCHSTGALNRFHSAIMNMLDGAWHPSVQTNTKSDYDFLVTLTDNIKDRNYIIAQRKIGNYIADLYNRIAAVKCPEETGQRKMMTSAETLFTQLRGIVGNANFAHLFGLKTIAKPTIHMQSTGAVSKLTMTRAGLRLPTDRPVAIYMSSSESKAKIVKLGQSNHADLDTSAMYAAMRDVQPRSSLFIISATSLPAINDHLLAIIGSAQTNQIRVNVITLDTKHISSRSLDLYTRIATLTNGHFFTSESKSLFNFIPLIEYSLMENQAMILSRTVPLNSARFHVPTDHSMTGMTIFASCAQGSPVLKMYEPTGQTHHEYVQLTQVDTLAFWLVENIAVGAWSVDITCPQGPITFEAASESSINFEIEPENENLVVKSLFIPTLKLASATLYTKERDGVNFSPMKARLGQMRMKKSLSPSVAQSTPLIDYEWMPETETETELSSSLLAPLELEQKSLDFDMLTPTKITGPLMSQSVAKVTATDENGETVQREVPVFDNHLEVKDDVAAIDFQPGSTVYVTIKVHNNNDVMHLTATDFEGWVDSISPSTTSAEDVTSLVKVKITAPADVKIGHETMVTVTARDNSLNRLNSVKFVLAVGQTENPEVKKMLVDSKIENRFGRTIIQSKVVNQHQNPRDAVFSVFLPDSAFITSYQLYIRNHTFKAEIIEPKQLEHPTDWVTPSTVTMEDEHEWRVKVRMDSWDEALFELIYDQSITKSGGKYPYKVNLKGRQDIEDVDIKVALYDEDGIADVAVINESNDMGIQQRGFGDFGLGGGDGLMGEESLADVQIDETRKSATISFNPTQSLFDEMSRSQGTRPHYNTAKKTHLDFFCSRRHTTLVLSKLFVAISVFLKSSYMFTIN